jgi:N-acetylglucosaminyldiphosphoundecaprenol N-acetyl-beta-D-mannosaminyltransferase
MKKYSILGVPVYGATKEMVLAVVDNSIQKGKKLQIATVNNEFILEAQKNPAFKEVLNQSFAIADSTGVVWAVKHLFNEKIEKIPGIDLAQDICVLCASRGYRLFLLGGAQGVATMAKKRLIAKYKGIHIVGAIDGIVIDPKELSEELISRINRSRCDMVFVGLGAPKQDIWIYNNIDKLNAKVSIGLGGTLDFMSGRIRRAPEIMRKLSLEWLYRLIVEPRRIGRILNAVVVFPLRILFSKTDERRG